MNTIWEPLEHTLDTWSHLTVSLTTFGQNVRKHGTGLGYVKLVKTEKNVKNNTLDDIPLLSTFTIA